MYTVKLVGTTNL